jgi:hypothetical protein
MVWKHVFVFARYFDLIHRPYLVQEKEYVLVVKDHAWNISMTDPSSSLSVETYDVVFPLETSLSLASLLPRLPQHIRNSIICRLPLEILPPKRSIPIPRESLGHPAHGVPEIPNSNAHTLLLVDTRPRGIGIHFCLDRLGARIARQRKPDIELRQRSIHAERRIERLCGPDVGVGRRTTDGEVSL